MLAAVLSSPPPLFSSTYGWHLEDLIIQNLPLDCNEEANSYNNNTPLVDQIKQDHFEQEKSISSGSETANGSTGDDHTMVAKKLNHNASERDRRKRVNDLYEFLRSLLPKSTNDHKKKVSIPGTVLRAVKYIPELQKEVETLLRKKEKLLSSYSTSTTSQEHPAGIKQKQIRVEEAATIKTQSSSVVSCTVSSLGEKEAIIQLISPPTTDHLRSKKNDQEISLLSKVLEYLEEEEEDELVLINATTFRSSCMGDQGMLLSTLHLQVKAGDEKIVEAEKLKEKLCARFPYICIS